jgi:hypothetical protein
MYRRFVISCSTLVLAMVGFGSPEATACACGNGHGYHGYPTYYVRPAPLYYARPAYPYYGYNYARAFHYGDLGYGPRALYRGRFIKHRRHW